MNDRTPDQAGQPRCKQCGRTPGGGTLGTLYQQADGRYLCELCRMMPSLDQMAKAITPPTAEMVRQATKDFPQTAMAEALEAFSAAQVIPYRKPPATAPTPAAQQTPPPAPPPPPSPAPAASIPPKPRPLQAHDREFLREARDRYQDLVVALKGRRLPRQEELATQMGFTTTKTFIRRRRQCGYPTWRDLVRAIADVQ